jgi:hypothetical protein
MKINEAESLAQNKSSNVSVDLTKEALSQNMTTKN